VEKKMTKWEEWGGRGGGPWIRSGEMKERGIAGGTLSTLRSHLRGKGTSSSGHGENRREGSRQTLQALLAERNAENFFY